MRSARRKQLRLKMAKKGNRFGWPFFAFSTLVFVLWFFVFSPHFWNGFDKLAVAVKRENGDASVVVFDPRLEEITTLTIPGDTEVNVARNMGLLRLKNVWQLGINEKLYGKLLAETLTNNFRFATFLWIDASGEGLINSDIGTSLKYLFVPEKTNVSFRDRLSIFLFNLKIKNTGRSEINLGKSLFLQKGKLSDGEAGFRQSGNLSERLTVYFSDYATAERGVRVFIKDSTGEYGAADELGRIIEVIGAKVVSIDKVDKNDSECLVIGGKREYVQKISRVFSCKEKIIGDEDVVTVEIGTGFSGRF